ncbi:hypothetical protein ACLOAV_010152 [Pseudogymnoascus australis]
MAHDGRDPTPMEWIYQTRSHGFKMRYTTPAARKIQWIRDEVLGSTNMNYMNYMNYTMDFDGVDFDIGPSIPGIDVEWTGNTLFDLFPGEQITTPQ